MENADHDTLETRIVEALRSVYDPEIPVNIYDLGLIYNVDISETGAVHVRMTLTAPACPVAGMLVSMVEGKVKAVAGVSSATVELVWDPPWSSELMSEAAKLHLNIDAGPGLRVLPGDRRDPRKP